MLSRRPIIINSIYYYFSQFCFIITVCIVGLLRCFRM